MNIFAYVRTLKDAKIVVICNFYADELEYHLSKEYENKKELLISNYGTIVPGRLRPFEGFMYRI